MKLGIDMSSLEPVIKALRRILEHYGIISFIFIMGILIFAVLVLQQAIATPTDTAYEQLELSKNTYAQFDKDTIEAVKRLRSLEDTSGIVTPSGRYNPFE